LSDLIQWVILKCANKVQAQVRSSSVNLYHFYIFLLY